MSQATNWEQARNMLCIRLDNMGDVLMTTPAILALKEACPDRRITLLASPAGAALAPFLSDVDSVITYRAPWVKNDNADSYSDAELIQTLRTAQFDAAVIFTVYSQSPLPAALMCRLAGIPLTLAHCRENPYHLLSHWVRETEPMEQTRHETQRQLDLVGETGACCRDARLRFSTQDTDLRSLSEKLDARGLALADIGMVAHCGATAPSRRYPPEQFVQALKQLGTRAGTIILTGDAAERSLTSEIRRRCETQAPICDLAGALSLGELACLIEQAPLLLSNNTGPVHLAAALDTPVVDLYALTNPQHTPWMVRHRVLFHDVPCKYCYRSICPLLHHDCLRKVSPQAVCEAVLDLQAETTQLSSQLAKAV